MLNVSWDRLMDRERHKNKVKWEFILFPLHFLIHLRIHHSALKGNTWCDTSGSSLPKGLKAALSSPEPASSIKPSADDSAPLTSQSSHISEDEYESLEKLRCWTQIQMTMSAFKFTVFLNIIHPCSPKFNEILKKCILFLKIRFLAALGTLHCQGVWKLINISAALWALKRDMENLKPCPVFFEIIYNHGFFFPVC